MTTPLFIYSSKETQFCVCVLGYGKRGGAVVSLLEAAMGPMFPLGKARPIRTALVSGHESEFHHVLRLMVPQLASKGTERKRESTSHPIFLKYCSTED